MATKIQLRRDTAANWASENPILASGEMGVETDTFKFKIGDATTAWNSLQYASSTYTDSDVDTHLNSNTAANGQFLSWNGTDYAWSNVSAGETLFYKDEPYVASNGLALINDPDFAIGSDDFYFELKFWMAPGNQYANIFALGADATYNTGPFYAYRTNNTDGRIYVFASNDGQGGNGTTMANLYLLGTNKFHNLILARNSGTVSLYFNGERVYNGNPNEITSLTADNLAFFKYADDTQIGPGNGQEYHQGFVFKKGDSIIDVSKTSIKTKLGYTQSGATQQVATDGDTYAITDNNRLFVTASATSTDTGFIAFGESVAIDWNSGAYNLHGDGTGRVLFSGQNITNKIISNGAEIGIAGFNNLYVGTRYSSIYTDNTYEITMSANAISGGVFGAVNLAINNVDKVRVKQDDTTITNSLKLTNIPTSDPSTANEIWNDNGVLVFSGSSAGSASDAHLNSNTAANGQFLSWNGTDYVWSNVSADGGSAITNPIQLKSEVAAPPATPDGSFDTTTNVTFFGPADMLSTAVWFRTQITDPVNAGDTGLWFGLHQSTTPIATAMIYGNYDDWTYDEQSTRTRTGILRPSTSQSGDERDLIIIHTDASGNTSLFINGQLAHTDTLPSLVTDYSVAITQYNAGMAVNGTYGVLNNIATAEDALTAVYGSVQPDQHFEFDGDTTNATGSDTLTIAGTVSYGTGYDGTANSAVVLTSNEGITLNSPSITAEDDDWFIGFWFKSDGTIFPSNSGILHTGFAGNNLLAIMVTVQNSTTQSLSLADYTGGTWQRAVATTQPIWTDWNHYAISRSGDSVYLYLNGVPVAEQSAVGDTYPTGQWLLGRYTTTVGGSYDDWRFYASSPITHNTGFNAEAIGAGSVKISEIEATGNTTNSTLTFKQYESGVLTSYPIYKDESVDAHLNSNTAANGQFLSWNGTDYAWDSVTSVSGFAIDTITIEPTVIPNSSGVAIGSSATVTGSSGPVAIGSYAAATDASAISIGNSSSSGGQQSISIGANATCGAGGDKGIAIGFGANAPGFGGVGIGQSANGGVNGVALGRNATNSLGSGIAIGFGANAGEGEIKIISSKSKIEYTAANGFVFTEDVGGTNTTYKLSSLAGASALELQDPSQTNEYYIYVGNTANKLATIQDTRGYANNLSYDQEFATVQEAFDYVMSTPLNDVGLSQNRGSNMGASWVIAFEPGVAHPTQNGSGTFSLAHVRNQVIFCNQDQLNPIDQTISANVEFESVSSFYLMDLGFLQVHGDIEMPFTKITNSFVLPGGSHNTNNANWTRGVYAYRNAYFETNGSIGGAATAHLNSFIKCNDAQYASAQGGSGIIALDLTSFQNIYAQEHSYIKCRNLTTTRPCQIENCSRIEVTGTITFTNTGSFNVLSGSRLDYTTLDLTGAGTAWNLGGDTVQVADVPGVIASSHNFFADGVSVHNIGAAASLNFHNLPTTDPVDGGKSFYLNSGVLTKSS